MERAPFSLVWVPQLITGPVIMLVGGAWCSNGLGLLEATPVLVGKGLDLDTPWTDAEAEAPILWPPDEKNQLIGKDHDTEED